MLGLHLQVSLTGIGKHSHDAITRAEAFRHLDRRPDIGTGGDADEHALFFAETARHLDRVLVGHGDDFVVYLAVQDAGDEAGADALDRVHTSSSAAEDG